MKNLFSKIKIDALEKKLEDSLSNIIQDPGEKIVKGIDDFSAKIPEEQWEIIQDKIEEGKNLLTSQKEPTESSEADNGREGGTKTTPASGAYLVCDGAMCSCDQGAMPMLKIPIDSHKKYYANDKLAATIKDSNLPSPFFVKCNLKSPPGDVSCTYAKADWVIKKGDGHPTAGDIDVLIDNGEISCPIGGKITIVNHGQQTALSSKDIGGFSVDAATAVNCLMPVDTIVEEGQEQKEMTTPSVKYIEYNGQTSDKKIAIIERSSQRLDFKATISSPPQKSTTNNSKKLKGDPRLVCWAIKKKGESSENWKIFAAYGDVIPLTFTEEGTYIILAYGKRPTTINNSDLIKFDKVKWDKNCFFELEVIKENTITHLDVNGVTVKESQTIIKGKECFITPKTRLPLTDEERKSLILEVRNGSNDALEHEQRGDAKHTLPTDQETEYQVHIYYEGSECPNPIKMTVIENETTSISPKMFPTDRYVRHGEEVTFTADFKDKDNVNPDKIHWKVDGVERFTGKILSFKFPSNKTKDINYKIEVYYKNLFSSKKSSVRTITAKQNSVNKIIIGNVNSGNAGFVDRSYNIKADTAISYTKVFDLPIKWEIVFIPSTSTPISKNDPAATIYSQLSSFKQMTTYSLEFTAEDKIKFIPHKVGAYTIATIFNGKTTIYQFIVNNSKVKTWRCASTNGWTLKQLGMKQAFNIELEIEGGGDQELFLSLYIECKGLVASPKEITLGKYKIDSSGKMPTVTIDKNHQFWKDVDKITSGVIGGYEIKQVSLVVSGKVYPFEGQHAVKEGLSLYLPNAQGDMIAPILKMNKYLKFEARFANAENNKLLKIVKYGESVKAQVRILKGYDDNKNVLKDKKYLFTLYENQKWGDKKIDGYKKVEKCLSEGEDIIEYDIATDKLGKDTHNDDKGNEFNPRLFYFLLEEKGRVYDSNILTHPKGLANVRNDETIIELETHDGENNDEIDKRNEKKIKNTGKTDRFDYFNQLKVAENTLLNKSLENKAMVIIGEELVPVSSGNCGGKYCLTKANYDKYLNLSKDKVGKLIQEINIRLAGFGGNVPTTEFDERTEATVKQFQRDYMGVTPTGKICGSLLKAIDEFSKKYKKNEKGKMECPCKKCYGFGKQEHLKERGDNKILERFRKYEYPGIHRSLFWWLRALNFYLEKKQIGYTFSHIESGYRCWNDNKNHSRTSTNHMGKALDLHFKNNKGQFAYSIKEIEEIRDKIVMPNMGAQIRWDELNKFSLEPTRKLYPKEFIATTWIHIDVREFELQYKEDEFFLKSVDGGNDTLSLLSLAKDLGFSTLTMCTEKNDVSKSPLDVHNCPHCKIFDKTANPQAREAYYKKVGSKMISYIDSIGVSNKFKALYMLAQRRSENGFKLDTPANNPMNLKCEGDLGRVSMETKETENGKTETRNENFGKFSSEEAGFNAYIEQLKKNWKEAYEILIDENKTIQDFTYALQYKGQLGAYATGVVDVKDEEVKTMTTKERDHLAFKSYKLDVENNFSNILKNYIAWYECMLICENHNDKESIRKDLELLKKMK